MGARRALFAPTILQKHQKGPLWRKGGSWELMLGGVIGRSILEISEIHKADVPTVCSSLEWF